MSKAMSDLMNDHEAILSALQVFTRILSKIQNTQSADPQELLAFLDFLREFADKCHHGKEEGLLFPTMTAFGLPDRGGPIGVMMAEHILGRGYIHDMQEALEGDVADLAAFELAGRKYIDLLQSHIHKENSVLFPMAEKLIPQADLDRLAAAFEEHEEKVIGHGRHAELHTFLDELHQKYPA